MSRDDMARQARRRALAMIAPLAALVSLVTLAGACEPVTEPAETRQFEVRTADGAPVPHDVACAAPANSEAWVTFGHGTLVVRGDATFTWRFETSSTRRSWTPGPDGERLNLVQSGQGGPREIEGTYRLEADGAYTLEYVRAATDGTPLTGTGYVLRDSAFIQEEMPCPFAPSGAAPHRFQLVLEETTPPPAVDG